MLHILYTHHQIAYYCAWAWGLKFPKKNLEGVGQRLNALCLDKKWCFQKKKFFYNATLYVKAKCRARRKCMQTWMPHWLLNLCWPQRMTRFLFPRDSQRPLCHVSALAWFRWPFGLCHYPQMSLSRIHPRHQMSLPRSFSVCRKTPSCSPTNGEISCELFQTKSPL